MTIDKDQETWPDKKKHKSLFSKSENMFFSKSFEMYFFQASSIQNQKEEKQR